MYVKKKGRIVDIPVKRGTVVKLRESRSGKVTNQRGIVVGTAPASNFSRAYGRQVYVCTFAPKGMRSLSKTRVSTKGANDLYPVGKVKKLPKACRAALAEYKATYPSLAGGKRRRR